MIARPVSFLYNAIILILLTSCGSETSEKGADSNDTLTEEQKHLPQNALKGLITAEGLEVKLMASEPALRNPTNIDVDDKGRIWVAEAFNYRPYINTTTAPEGDRIMIFEDNDGDGIAEESKVFYQGPEINAPLGISIIDDRVIVSQSPYVWAFFDDNGDDKADRKEILFQGISGEQHDHGMHSFIAGPDGKLYFNFGNAGVSLRDRNNKIVVDQYGDSIGSPKYKQGMVFRCDPDGSNIERLAHNFRNNYEVAVDSYGTMWQSDNDDDGNRGVRINYVMDYGNYGYTDEMTGAYWRASRTNMEDSIPFKHWHLNDPGVVPNLLQTGSGSPTGIIVYEGSLLPEKFQNQVIHCEPGHNVVRAYPVKKDGAGYTASIENILKGEKDQWFRPSDVCVAPDGSLIIADWYDPVVGGHAARDKESGRIYRIAPKGTGYKIPKFDYSTEDGAVSALQNPNLVVRNKAWRSIQKFGISAVPSLEKLYSSSEGRMKVRAFWALVKLPGGEKYIVQAINDNNPEVRIAGIRAARQLNYNVIPTINKLVDDKDKHVLRECALALHKNKSPEAAALWARLAEKHDGKDRWYLEALGIGAADQWDTFFNEYIKKINDPLNNAAGRDIVWRARSDKSLPYLVKLAGDESASLKSRLKYFRSFDFNPGPAKTNALITMISENKKNDPQLNAVLLQGLDPNVVRSSPVAKRALNNVLDEVYGTMTFIHLVDRYKVKSEAERLLKLALDKPDDEIAPEAITLVLDFNRSDLLTAIIKRKDEEKISRLLRAVSRVGNGQTIKILEQVLLGKEYSDTLRVTAAKMFARSWNGSGRLVDHIRADRLSQNFITASVEGLKEGPRQDLILAINEHLSAGSGKPKEPFDREGVLQASGNVAKGEKIFKTNCAICHQVKGQGTDFGPALNEIGSKLPKDGLLDAIAEPSAGISFGYETIEITMKDGSKIQGLLANQTENEISIKLPGGSINTIEAGKIKTMSKLRESLMPELHQAIPKQDLADLLEYLSTLKKK